MKYYYPGSWLAYIAGILTVIAMIYKIFFTSWRGALACIGIFFLLGAIGAIYEYFQLKRRTAFNAHRKRNRLTMDKLQAVMKMSALIARPYFWEDEAVLFERITYYEYLHPDYDSVPCEPGVVRQKLIDNEPVGIISKMLHVGHDIWWSDYDGCWMTLEYPEYTYLRSHEPWCPIESAL